MTDLKISNLTKTYGNGVTAVDDFNLEVKDGEFIVIVGASGCGKSTTLRMIAGLEKVTSGSLFLDGREIRNVETKDRDMAMVFQNYALYENMTVFENIAFPLKIRKESSESIYTKVKNTADLLKISHLLSRKPKTLSGGEKQRVAMGRAIVRNPKLFLMDEPLSNLDAKLRLELREEIRRLQKTLGTTTIYVTHDQAEAMSMADRVVVMDKGKIQQVDAPETVYNSPANPFVAGFFGSIPMNIWEEDGKTYGIRPEDILLSIIEKPQWTEAKIINSAFNGNQWILEIEACGRKLTACNPSKPEDGSIWALLPEDKLHCWER